VSYEVTDAVAVIELREGASSNALDVHLRGALLTAARRLTTDATREVRAALITARGRHSCVGQDLKEHTRLLKDAPAAAFARSSATTDRHPLYPGPRRDTHRKNTPHEHPPEPRVRKGLDGAKSGPVACSRP
jgi:enoyl-CoA hydratase/carnithine racemase